ncbi:MAG: hypothetical protein K0S12_1025, partial [Bacteroidetes bacterium]|nr:hypothetical protein [Bacteroidota bacterium]
LPGCLIFIALVVTVIVTALKVLRKSTDKKTRVIVLSVLLGLMTFFLHAFFNGFIEFDKVALPVFMSFAAITAFDINMKKKETA